MSGSFDIICVKGRYMQEFQQISSIYTERKLPNRNKIGLLGGTFNPVHNGHIIMAEIALCEFLLGEVIFLPSGRPPHKTGELVAPAYQRIEMLELAIEGCECFSVSTLEVERQGATYTIDTLEYLKGRHPLHEYYYIIGSDTLFELSTWRNIDRVLTLTNFICVLRPGIDDYKAECYAELLSSKYPCKIYIADEKGPGISSTQVRQLAAKGQLRSNLVPENVARYIRQNRVYFDEE